MREFNKFGALNVGDTIEFTRKYYKETCKAIVVDIVFFSHCIGASSIKVVDYEDQCCTIRSLPLCDGVYTIISRVQSEKDAAGALAIAHAAMIKSYSKYPIWADRFATNPNYPMW
jgi:hypothetical protein